jgi:hypothetical protein
MPEALTVARSRAYLEKLVDDPSTQYFPRLNEAMQRLVETGDWLRSDFVQEVQAPDGYLVLGRRAAALLGLGSAQGHGARSAFPLAHEYIDAGPGEFQADLPMGLAIEQPNVCTYRLIPTAQVLTFVIGHANDAGKSARVYGLDAAGRVVFGTDGVEGELVTFTVTDPGPQVLTFNTTNLFSKVTGLDLAAGRKTYLTLKAGALEIGRYEPGERNPSYRCYKVGTAPDSKGYRVLCSRCHVDAAAESDLLFPPHVGALRCMITAMIMEENNDQQTAMQNFSAAYAILNSASGKAGGAALPVVRVQGYHPIPSLM